MPEWIELMGDKPDESLAPYSPKSSYKRMDMFLHSKFGKGVVMVVQGSHVEVLFADGTKKLGHVGDAPI